MVFCHQFLFYLFYDSIIAFLYFVFHQKYLVKYFEEKKNMSHFALNNKGFFFFFFLYIE